jgi:diketogulonate reductase-like aldo/keto reductase
MVPVLPANGANMPALGLGTSRMRGADCARAVETAFSVGFRHIDTADMYGNEVEVGQGLRASGVKRADAFITTKVLPSNIGPGDLQRSAQASLKRLALDDVDLLLIHWPNSAIPLEKSIEALCDAKKRGYAKNIGVANFTRDMVDEAVTLAARHGEKIACNQCEYHPRLDQTKLIEVCRKHGVAFVSYYPLAQGRYIDDPTLTKVAKTHGRSVAQVMLRWHMQQGVAAIPKSSSRVHLQENISIFDFTLSQEEMRAISAMARPGSRMVNPAGFAPKWDD